MSRREEAKEQRREGILAAAESLIRRDGGVEFSMRELADAAGVAFATPFNLFDSKERLLRALLLRRVQPRQLALAAAAPGDDPVDHFFEFVTGALGTYASDAPLFQPLLRAALSADQEPGGAAIAAGTEFWMRCLEPARRVGVLPEDDGELLARVLHLGFRGVLLGWARNEVTTEVAARDLTQLCGRVFGGAATEEHRPAIEMRLRDATDVV